MLADSRPAPSRRKRCAIEREPWALDFRFAENRIIDLVEMTRVAKIDVAREVAAMADNMRRNARRLQAILDRCGFLLARPGRDRRLQLIAIAQSSDNSAELRVAQFHNHRAKCVPMSWRRRVDRNPSILTAAWIQTLGHLQRRSGEAAALWNRAVRGVLVICRHHELDPRFRLRGIDVTSLARDRPAMERRQDARDNKSWSHSIRPRPKGSRRLAFGPSDLIGRPRHRRAHRAYAAGALCIRSRLSEQAGRGHDDPIVALLQIRISEL